MGSLTDYDVGKVITGNSSSLCLIPQSIHRNGNIWLYCRLQRRVTHKRTVPNSGSGSCSGGRRGFTCTVMLPHFFLCLYSERCRTRLLFYSTNFIQCFHLTSTEKRMRVCVVGVIVVVARKITYNESKLVRKGRLYSSLGNKNTNRC